MADKEHSGFCIQCRGKKIIVNPMPHKQPNAKTKNHNIDMVKGRCPDCGCIIYHILGHG